MTEFTDKTRCETNPHTTIRFSVPEKSPVTLHVYDVTGRRMTTLANRDFAPGVHSVTWGGTNHYGTAVSSGISFYRITAGANTATRKMLLLR